MGHFLTEEHAQDLVEYSLLIAFLALGLVAVISNVKTNILNTFTTLSSALLSVAS